MAGGTGGHVFPALAVAEQLRGQGCEVSWLGTRKGIEAEQVPAHGYTISYLAVAGIRGKGVWTKIRALFSLIHSLGQALKTVYVGHPDVVLGFGGFAAGPGGVAAFLLGKPLVIHEQNAVAGTTNRLLSKPARCVLTAFPEAFPAASSRLKAKTELCGNPVRQEIIDLGARRNQRGAAESEGRVRLLVLGGSLGADPLNRVLPQALARIPEEKRPEVRHQCGRGRQQNNPVKTTERYQKARVSAEITPFIADMAEAYSWADFVICRAGALTVSELAIIGLPAVLVPLPHAIDDHQTCNAQWLVKAGAGRLLPENELQAEAMAALIVEMIEDQPGRVEMAEKARQLARPDAAQRVAAVCLEVAA